MSTETAMSHARAVMEKVIEKAIDDGNDKATMRTVYLRFVWTLLKESGLSWNDVSDLIHNYTPVHSQVAREILDAGLKDEEAEFALAQDFVRHDKIFKMLKRIPRRKAEALCAMDGLAGNLSVTGPTFDFKRYLENLRYSIDGTAGNFDDIAQGAWKRSHISAMRTLYKHLNDIVQGNEPLSPYAYQVLRKVILNVGGPELVIQSSMNPEMRLEDDVLNKCIEMYLCAAGRDTVYSLISNLNVKLDKREKTDDEDEEVSAKKRRVEREVERR